MSPTFCFYMRKIKLKNFISENQYWTNTCKFKMITNHKCSHEPKLFITSQNDDWNEKKNINMQNIY